jgi:hypothetical protein
MAYLMFLGTVYSGIILEELIVRQDRQKYNRLPRLADLRDALRDYLLASVIRLH